MFENIPLSVLKYITGFQDWNSQNLLMLIRIANREDPDQTASDLGLHCLSRPFWQLVRGFSALLLRPNFSPIPYRK